MANNSVIDSEFPTINQTIDDERKVRKCNSSLRKFISEEHSYKITQLKNIEDEVDTMATYNSIDKQGMDKYLKKLKNDIHKNIFPED